MKEIQELNANPNEKARFEINHFGDWTQEEKEKILGMPKNLRKSQSKSKIEQVEENEDEPNR